MTIRVFSLIAHTHDMLYSHPQRNHVSSSTCAVQLTWAHEAACAAWCGLVAALLTRRGNDCAWKCCIVACFRLGAGRVGPSIRRIGA
jgi:hypothetical protein